MQGVRQGVQVEARLDRARRCARRGQKVPMPRVRLLNIARVDIQVS